MKTLVLMVRKWYLMEIRALHWVGHVFLLIVRVYFGWEFMRAGSGKLLNVSETAELFAGWDIPLPTLNVYLAGTTETVGGFLLLIGAASRIITIPLIGTMLVAYATAHTEQLHAFWGNTAYFFKAPPFPYLYTAIVVLLFGPGLFSVDAVVKRYLDRLEDPTKGGTAANPGRAAPNE
jgi:putative oxidoreductase